MAFTKTPFLGVAAVLGLLSACTDPGSYQPLQSERVQNGAVIGGLIGAGVGALTADDDVLPTVLATGAVGALIGGVIGNELDKQAAELRQEIDNQSVTIVNAGDRLIVTFPNDITFATDSAVVAPALRSDLAAVSGSLQRYPGSIVRVIGHTDSDGDADYNQALSERRANAVADVIQAGGVPYNRLAIIGRGENDPVASNLTPDGKAQNRRVEVEIIPQRG